MMGTELPDCRVSRTICSFSCTDHCLRLRTCLLPDPVTALCSVEVSTCSPRGHLLSCPSICKWAHPPRPGRGRLCGLCYTVTYPRGSGQRERRATLTRAGEPAPRPLPFKWWDSHRYAGHNAPAYRHESHPWSQISPCSANE